MHNSLLTEPLIIGGFTSTVTMGDATKTQDGWWSPKPLMGVINVVGDPNLPTPSSATWKQTLTSCGRVTVSEQ